MEFTAEQQAAIDTQIQAALATQQEQYKLDTERLVKNRDDLLNEKKEAQRKELEAQQLLDSEALAKAAANKDVETLTTSYEGKLKLLQDEVDGMKDKNLQSAKSQLANDFVNSNVVDDAFSRQAMADAYKNRIDIRDGKTVVLDPEGNLTALTVEDLNKEFVSASIYANHIKGTQAVGGGAEGNKGSGGAVSLKDMTATEEAQFANQNPELYAQLIG